MKDKKFEQFTSQINEKLDKVLCILSEMNAPKTKKTKKSEDAKIDFNVDNNLLIKIAKNREILDSYKGKELAAICRYLKCSASGNKDKLKKTINTKLDFNERLENR